MCLFMNVSPSLTWQPWKPKCLLDCASLVSVLLLPLLLFWGVSLLPCIYCFAHFSILLISNCAETFYLNAPIYCHSLKLCLQFPVSTTTVTMAPPSVCRPSHWLLPLTHHRLIPWPSFPWPLLFLGPWMLTTGYFVWVIPVGNLLVTALGCFLQQGCQGLVHMPSVVFTHVQSPNKSGNILITVSYLSSRNY